MNQHLKTLATLFITTLAIAACSHAAKKPDTVHIDTASGGSAATNDGFVETAQAGETGQTLFQRVGGMKTLTDFSNKFVEALAETPQLSSNPKAAAGFAKGASRFKDQLAIQLCELSDGPCKYKGTNMKDAHAGMGITADQWRAMGKIFIKVLRDVGVQKNERMELANRVARFKTDIVSSSGLSSSPAAATATRSASAKKSSAAATAAKTIPPADDGDLPLPAIDGQ